MDMTVSQKLCPPKLFQDQKKLHCHKDRAIDLILALSQGKRRIGLQQETGMVVIVFIDVGTASFIPNIAALKEGHCPIERTKTGCEEQRILAAVATTETDPPAPGKVKAEKATK